MEKEVPLAEAAMGFERRISLTIDDNLIQNYSDTLTKQL